MVMAIVVLMDLVLVMVMFVGVVVVTASTVVVAKHRAQGYDFCCIICADSFAPSVYI